MWVWLGWIFVAVGAVGVFLPVMPTVPFLILAAFCFERGSPRLHRWLLEHSTFGPPLKDWREKRVIRPRAKILAVGSICCSVIFVVFFRDVGDKTKIAMIVTCALAIVFILAQKSRHNSEDANGL